MGWDGMGCTVPAMMPLSVCWKLLSGPGAAPPGATTVAPAGLAIITDLKLIGMVLG